mmetsp:Transcript_28313/g.63238  ORF Transcript_28313/g.63238 Transcript_28313/m.63238 type:complete len:316 (-) Transcript_28313:297-1244(-)
MARVRVYNPGLLEGLVAEVPDAEHGSTAKRKDGESPIKTSTQLARAKQKQHLKDLEDVRNRRYERSRREAHKRETEEDRKVRENIALQGLRREKKYQDNFSSITEGRDLCSRIKKQQDLEDEAERNKKVQQFQQWNQEVYGKIQGRVAEQLETTTSAQITRRRNKEFDKFLEVTNTKGAIFRDIIIESEYDPLEPNRNSIKVKTGDISDPVSRVLDKQREEVLMLASKEQQRAAKEYHTREVLEVTDWGTGRIESTPHGFFAKMMAKSDRPPPTEPNPTFKSMVHFDHYHHPRNSKAAVDAEFPKGRRTTLNVYS